MSTRPAPRTPDPEAPRPRTPANRSAEHRATDPAATDPSAADPAATDTVPSSAGVELLAAEGLTERDVQQVTSLLGRLVDAGAALGWVTPPASTEISELVRRLAAGTEAGESAAAIARRDDEITGFAYWTRYTRPTFRPHVDIEKVAVDPGAQGRGVGRGLMEALIQAARGHGTEVITLDLRGDNGAAIGLYESLGFTRYGRLSDFVAVGQKRFDTLLYSRDLRL